MKRQFLQTWLRSAARVLVIAAIIGYEGALMWLVVSTYRTPPPFETPPTEARVWQQRPPQTNFDIYPGTNLSAIVRTQLTWKTSMIISPTMRVNSEDISVGHVPIRRQD